MPRRIIAGLTGVALAGLLASTAFAYVGTITAVNVNAPAKAVSGAEFGISVQVLGEAPAAEVNPAAAGIAGEPVAWDYQVMTAGGGSAAVVTLGRVAAATVTLAAFETQTDADGIATNTATIVCDGCTVVFTATVDEVVGRVEVTVPAASLPNTATATASTGISTGLIATILAIFAVIAGAGLMVRQVVVTRR